jgi:hypothetical protein
MLHDITSFISNKWLDLIGRPNLTLNSKCGNIVCSKNDKFKKYVENQYICECGFELFGEFEVVKETKPKLVCSINPCIESKIKMDIGCLRCKYIRER